MPGKRDATRISSRPGTTRPFSSPPHVRYRSEPGYASTQREQMVAGQAPPKRQPNGGGGADVLDTGPLAKRKTGDSGRWLATRRACIWMAAAAQQQRDRCREGRMYAVGRWTFPG